VKSTPGKVQLCASSDRCRRRNLNGERLAFFVLRPPPSPRCRFNGHCAACTSPSPATLPIVFTSLPVRHPIVLDLHAPGAGCLSNSRVESPPDVPGTTESGIEACEGDTVLRHRRFLHLQHAARYSDSSTRESTMRPRRQISKRSSPCLGFGCGVLSFPTISHRIQAEIFKWRRSSAIQHQGRLIWLAISRECSDWLAFLTVVLVVPEAFDTVPTKPRYVSALASRRAASAFLA